MTWYLGLFLGAVALFLAFFVYAAFHDFPPKSGSREFGDRN